MRIVRVFALSCLVVLAGCSFAVGSAPPPDSLAPANETCLQTETDPSRLDSNGDLEPMAYPEPPTNVDERTVGEYAVSFERAYLRNARLGVLEDRTVDGFEQSFTDPAVEREGDGYVVSFEETYAFDYADGNLTDRLFLEYFLNESTVLREVRYERDEDPFANRVVRCRG